MKNAIVKAVVLCTLALSLLCMGVAAVDAVNTGVEVSTANDGPFDGLYEHDYVY